MSVRKYGINRGIIHVDTLQMITRLFEIEHNLAGGLKRKSNRNVAHDGIGTVFRRYASSW